MESPPPTPRTSKLPPPLKGSSLGKVLTLFENHERFALATHCPATSRSGSLAYFKGPAFFAKVGGSMEIFYESKMHKMVQSKIQQLNDALGPTNCILRVPLLQDNSVVTLSKCNFAALVFDRMNLQDAIRCERGDPIAIQIFQLLQTICGVLQTDIGAPTSRYLNNIVKIGEREYVVMDFGRAIVAQTTTLSIEDILVNECTYEAKWKCALQVFREDNSK